MKVLAAIALVLAGADGGAATRNGGDITDTVVLNNGVEMPRMNLGTCCGSSPDAGLPGWLAEGGVGIDTAWDYHDQPNISRVLKDLAVERSTVFITSKVPAGFGNATDCNADPDIVLRYARENLDQLGVEYVDLLLLHAPCDFSQTPVDDPTASNQALWQGAQEALRLNLTRAIGVSNYNVTHLTGLNSTVVPAVNQCQLSVNGSFDRPAHDDHTIAYCHQEGIVYESYGAMKGCPWNDSKTADIAADHNKTVAQVCLRWAVQVGGAVAAGTGADPASAKDYAKENLGIFDFSLTNEEVDYLNHFAQQ